MVFITITEDEFASTLGTNFTRTVSSNEVCFECPVSSVGGVVVRIYSSIAATKGQSRGKGKDAIRVLAIDTVTDRCVVNPHKKGKSHIKRTNSWAKNTLDMAREVYKTVAQRKTWIESIRKDTP